MDSRQGMQPLHVSDLINLAQREYEACGYACAKTWPPQSVPLERLLGRVPVSPTNNLSFLTIENYKLERVREGAARATVNRELDGLSKGLTLAIDASMIQAEDKPKIRRFKLRNARQGFVYPEEFYRIWQHLPHLVQDIAAVAYWSGWRRGEVTGLTWNRVEENWIRTRDKNGDPKSAALIGPVASAVKRRRAYQREGCPLVFHRSGERVTSFYKAWNAAVQDAKIGRHVIFHDLRRSFINNGRRAQIDRKVLMQMTGHKTHSVFDRYQFVNEDEQEDAARRIFEQNNPTSSFPVAREKARETTGSRGRRAE